MLTFTVEGKAFDIGPGESCFIPRGAVHGFTNVKQTAAKALAVVTPALIGPDHFKELDAIASPGSPPDIEKVKAVMAKHGLVPVMPQG
jgi:cupin domain